MMQRSYPFILGNRFSRLFNVSISTTKSTQIKTLCVTILILCLLYVIW